MPKYTEYLNMAIEPELKAAIAAEAEDQGRTISAMARLTLRRVYLADQATVEQCREDAAPVPIDPEAEDRFLYPEKHRLNPATTLIDTRAEYDASHGRTS